MRKIFFAVLLVFGFTLANAKDLPEALVKAKTAVVENARAEQKDIDKLCAELKKWGRFELVPDRGKADIVITLTTEMKEQMITGPGGRMQNQQSLVNLIKIFQVGTETLLWSDQTSTYSKDPKALVSNLKSKLKNK